MTPRASVTVLLATTLVAASVMDLGARQTRAVRKARHPIPNQYIVVLKDGIDPDAMAFESSLVHGGRVRRVFRRTVRGFVARVGSAAAERLARDPRVRFVEEDGLVHIAQVQAAPPWGLDRVDQRLLPLDASYAHPLLGQGVYVHILDTGVRVTHEEFGGRAAIAGDYIDDDGDGDPEDVGNDDGNPGLPDGADCHGHGTHVASTVGGATYGVAKGVTILGHRVLACNGSGPISGIIAAIEAVTADPRRPAIANMSLGSAPNEAMDEALRVSIASGVTFVVAAGNSNFDAQFASPARVVEAITVGASTQTDARASFSNYGPLVDVFAPGSLIDAAWHTHDTATQRLSGTSMAAPHVAGVAALYLEGHPEASPDEVRQALVSTATPNALTAIGTDSPNRLVFAGLTNAAPTVGLIRPTGGEKAFANTPFLIEWVAEDANGLVDVDVLISTDGGASYDPIPGCTDLDGQVSHCVWHTPSPLSTKARVRVIVTDAHGEMSLDQSTTNFSIVNGTGTIRVTAPNSAVNWGRGSTQLLKWTHNLGNNSWVRLDLSRDGGATFTETIAEAVKNQTSSSGYYVWTIPGPTTNQAIVRATWTAGPLSDVSDKAFTIAEPFISAVAPAKSTATWAYGADRQVGWKTNLGPYDLVDINLSVDAGATFPLSLRTFATASLGDAAVVVPVLPAPVTTARAQVVWVNAPFGMQASAASAKSFQIKPGAITVTAPNGGETWTAGQQTTVRWSNNLGGAEQVRLELSTDDGATYPHVVLASTPADGSQAVIVQPAWISPTARLRIVWVDDPSVADVSNASFRVQ